VKRPVDRASKAALVVRRAIAASVRTLLANEACVIHGRDPEPLHKARVAVRRLRSDLRGFRSLVDRDWSASLRQELRWLGAEFGAVRDLDVLIIRLRADAARAKAVDDPGVHAVIAKFLADRKAARKELLASMRSERYAALRARLSAAARAPRFTLASRMTAVDGLLPIVVTRWKRLRGAVEALPARPGINALHRIRILAKRCRYAAEAAAIAFGRPAKLFASAAANLQDVLGTINDAAVATVRLRRLRRDPQTALAAMAFLTIEGESAARARAEWPAAWRALDDKGLRSWL
jgi:CHAD domain-containing protein